MLCRYNGQSSAIQDCLYRSMFSTQYLAYLDLDEFLIPESHVQLGDVFDQLWLEKPNAAGFHVKPKYFWLQDAQETTVTEFYPFTRYG